MGNQQSTFTGFTDYEPYLRGETENSSSADNISLVNHTPSGNALTTDSQLGTEAGSDMVPTPSGSDHTVTSGTVFETSVENYDEVTWAELKLLPVIETEAVESLENEDPFLPVRHPYPENVEQATYIKIPTIKHAPNGSCQIYDTDHYYANIDKTFLADLKAAYVIPTILYKRSPGTWELFNDLKYRHFVYAQRERDEKGKPIYPDIVLTRVDRRVTIGFAKLITSNGKPIIEWQNCLELIMNPEERDEKYLDCRRWCGFGRAKDDNVCVFPDECFVIKDGVKVVPPDDWTRLDLHLEVLARRYNTRRMAEKFCTREIMLRKPWEDGKTHVRCGKRDRKIFYPYTIPWGKRDPAIEQAVDRIEEVDKKKRDDKEDEEDIAF